jgi:sugar/nucleoside kinase (ribokinase family)
VRNPVGASAQIVVFGSLNADLVVAVPRLPRPAETVIGDRLQTFPGGKGANQAVAAARLGGSVCMVGRVGRDAFGDMLLQSLATDGVDTSEVGRDAEEPTGVALDRGAGAAVVTLGAAGAVVVDPSGSTPVAAFPVVAVDATAAGDAFVGALALSLLRGADLVSAAGVGAAAGAAAATRHGAQTSLPRPADLEAILATRPPST